MSLVRASTASLELAWPATPATNTYILEVQKLPPTASPSPVSTPTPIQQPLQQPTPVAATASAITKVNSAGNVYRLQKSATASVQQPVRVIGSPMAAGAKLGTVLGKSTTTGVGGHQVMSVVKGAQFVSPIVAGKAAGSVASGTVQRATTIGGIKQITTGGSLIHQQGAGGNIVTVSPQQASNLVGQKIVLQKSTLQQFQQQGTSQKVNVSAGGGVAGGGPQIVKLVKTAQGTMQVQGAVSGTKVVNPATGKIIQMPTGQQFFTINKSSGQVTAATSAGGTVAGQQVQKRIITTGPGGTEQQIIVVSQSPNTSMQIRPNIVGQTATTGARGPIKIQTMAGGTKQFTIGGKPVTVQLGGVGKRPLTLMTPQHAGGSAINAQAAGSAGGQTAGGQQILILPSGQGGVLQQAGGRKSYIQIVGGSAGGATGQQTTVTGQKIMPRIVINQPQQLHQQGQGNTSGGGGGSGSGGASNIEQVDGAMDGE